MLDIIFREVRILVHDADSNNNNNNGSGPSKARGKDWGVA